VIGKSGTACYRFLRSAPHFAQVGAGQNVTRKPRRSNTDVPQTGQRKILPSQKFAGNRNTKARQPNAIEYGSADASKAAIMNPNAAKKAAVTERSARVLRVILDAERFGFGEPILG
jgi:hypothetical protein